MILPAPPVFAVLLACLGCLILFMPRGIPGRYLGGVLLLPVLFVPIARLEQGQLKLTLLDVGQGLATVIRTRNHVLVYDTGERYSERFDSGKNVVLPYLRSEGIKRIDLLMISHGDNDHIGGAESILQQTPVSEILTSVPADIKSAQAKACQAGQTWVWDQVIFTVLSPGEQRFKGKNDNSCVLKITSKVGSILLTGDIEQPAEAQLLTKYGAELQADIMIAPHHGSNTSSGMAFIQAVQPKQVLIPAGYRNRFGFPDQRVLDRYQKIDVAWLNVGLVGAVTVESAGVNWLIESYRDSERKYWHQ